MTANPIDNATNGDDTINFEQHRNRLFGIAYRMLGSAMEAEDMVQEAFLRWQQTDTDTVRSPKSFLNTVVTRLCLDHLKSAKVQREEYIGPWLPEPVLTSNAPEWNPAGRYEQEDSISLAFLTLLENLTPIERAVFLLRAVFDYEYSEIAEMTNQTVDACRQSFSRAKKHVQRHKPRFNPSPEEHQRMLTGFMNAVVQGDVDGLTSMLAEDVEYWADGGGKASAATRVVTGAENVTKVVMGLRKRIPEDIITVIAEINGLPSFLYYTPDYVLEGVASIDVVDGKVVRIHQVRNPDKLRMIARDHTAH